MYEWTLHILKTTTKTQKRWEKKIDDLMGKKIGGEVTLNDKNKRRKKNGWRKKDKKNQDRWEVKTREEKQIVKEEYYCTWIVLPKRLVTFVFPFSLQISPKFKVIVFWWVWRENSWISLVFIFPSLFSLNQTTQKMIFSSLFFILPQLSPTKWLVNVGLTMLAFHCTPFGVFHQFVRQHTQTC